MNLSERKEYIDRIEKFTKLEAIVVLVGQRRIGKSYLLRFFMEIKNKENNANIIFIDKEKREFGNLRRINDNYPKYVISMTPLVSKNDDNGIIHLGLRKFLTDGFC